MASVPRPRPLTAADRQDLGGKWASGDWPVGLLILALSPVSAACYYVAGCWAWKAVAAWL